MKRPIVRKTEDAEDRQLQREEEENRQRRERRIESMRKRWLQNLRIPEEQ